MTRFDRSERRIWAGTAHAYAATFARLCAHPVPALLDAAAVGPRTRTLDAGTGPGTVAAAAHARGAVVTAVDAEPSMAALARRSVPAAAVHIAALPRLPYPDAAFDAVVANFVLNHVGRPAAALAELRRVLRPGGALALTLWPSPPASGQALLGRALHAAGVVRPPELPSLAPEDDFPRTPAGITALLDTAGFRRSGCERLDWEHRAGREEWWSGPASGVASVGRLVRTRTPEVRAAIKHHFDALSVEFADEDGVLTLPHSALLATAHR